jgi:hypothetical protein
MMGMGVRVRAATRVSDDTPSSSSAIYSTTPPLPLSEFQFYPRERFVDDHRFEVQTSVWRHQIRMEKGPAAVA